MRAYISILTILISFGQCAVANESGESIFHYGPQHFEEYRITSGVISMVHIPEWLEGQWWARYYVEPGNRQLKHIPRSKEQGMGRPFEFYGWLVRVPEGSSSHSDYKVIRMTHMQGANAWVLNLISIANPERGASLVINKKKPQGADEQYLVLRWRYGRDVEDRAIVAAPSNAESIMAVRKHRKDYLEKKYIDASDSTQFNYKKWHTDALSRNKPTGVVR